MPNWRAAAPRAAPATTSRRFPGRCSTASICIWKCPPPAENSAAIAKRVAAARAIQSERYADTDPTIRTNAEADGKLLESVAAPDEPGRALPTQADERLKLGARGYHRVLRVARTLADLAGEAQVRRIHIAEALSYRRIAPVG